MRDIRLDLSVPVLAFGVGPFRFDPIQTLLGCSFEDLVESLLVAPSFERAAAGGGRVTVYPLALPDGEGAAIPLGRFGEASFANEAGQLVLIVPVAMRSLLQSKVQSMLVQAPERVTASGAPAWRFTLLLRPGLAFRLPLGSLGEVGVECV